MKEKSPFYYISDFDFGGIDDYFCKVVIVRGNIKSNFDLMINELKTTYGNNCRILYQYLPEPNVTLMGVINEKTKPVKDDGMEPEARLRL